MKKLEWFRLALLSVVLVFVQSTMAADPPAQPLEVSSNSTGTVDINSADAATLASILEGVGMAKANEIVAYREEFGDFKTAEQLLDVKGIGKATVDKNRQRIKITKK